MKRNFGPCLLALAAVLLVLSAATSASATTLQGCPVSPTACTVDASSTVAGGTFNTGPLTFAPNIVVTTTADITINVAGNLIFSAGSGINANQTCPKNGSDVTLDVNGDITMPPRSFVTANGCSGGAIIITSHGQGKTIDIDGLVQSKGFASGTGGNQAPGGGPISITSDCFLNITPDGIVSSEGFNPGADLVALKAGCKLHIFGLVQSTGIGHAQPSNPPNHCAVDLNGNPTGHAPTTACVSLVAGDEIFIDGVSPNKGEVKADLKAAGKVPWIDIFANGFIQIQNDFIGPFAVHANNEGATNLTGGDVTVKSSDSFVLATGLAISASAKDSGGQGGEIVVQAKGDVNLRPDGQFKATGSTFGGAPHGGTISIQSFGSTPPPTGSILGTDPGPGPGSLLDVTGGVTANGAVNLTACLAIDFPPGVVKPVTPMKHTNVCGGNPTIPDYALPLPVCPAKCTGTCQCVSTLTTVGNTLTLGGGTNLAAVTEVRLSSAATCDSTTGTVPNPPFALNGVNIDVNTTLVPAGTYHVITVAPVNVCCTNSTFTK